MGNREVFISQRLAHLAASVAIASRGLRGAEPVTKRVSQREHDGTLTQGFAALVRFPDGRVTALDFIAA